MIASSHSTCGVQSVHDLCVIDKLCNGCEEETTKEN